MTDLPSWRRSTTTEHCGPRNRCRTSCTTPCGSGRLRRRRTPRWPNLSRTRRPPEPGVRLNVYGMRSTHHRAIVAADRRIAGNYVVSNMPARYSGARAGATSTSLLRWSSIALQRAYRDPAPRRSLGSRPRQMFRRLKIGDGSKRMTVMMTRHLAGA